MEFYIKIGVGTKLFNHFGLNTFEQPYIGIDKAPKSWSHGLRPDENPRSHGQFSGRICDPATAKE